MNTATVKHPSSALIDEVLAGLRSRPKYIAPKYFYNKKGAELFDAITELDEYYVTRTEEEIFRDHREQICESIGTGATVIEPGAGSCEKIRWLLPQLEPARYRPMDISAEHLQQSAQKLREDYPGLAVEPQVCDHTAGLKIVDKSPPLVFFYPGSSIGNFEPDDAVAFMESMRSAMGDFGGLLIGVDAKKDVAVLHDAYNDERGVTAEFNLNVLSHLNQRFGGNLETENFEHVAGYDQAEGRIEMHLRCKRSHQAELGEEVIDFAAGEMIHTENSYKYHPDEFIGLAKQAGLAFSSLWQDRRGWFSLLYLVPG
jgi:dimethylhistidine N-methyltransferase